MLPAGHEQFNPRRSGAGQARPNEVGTICLTGDFTQARSAGDPLVIECGVLICVDVQHASADGHVCCVELRSRIPTRLTFVGVPGRSQRAASEIGDV